MGRGRCGPSCATSVTHPARPARIHTSQSVSDAAGFRHLCQRRESVTAGDTIAEDATVGSRLVFTHCDCSRTDAPRLYDQQRNYHGKLSTNPYDPDSASSPVDTLAPSYNTILHEASMPFSIRPHRRFSVRCAVMIPKSLLREQRERKSRVWKSSTSPSSSS